MNDKFKMPPPPPGSPLLDYWSTDKKWETEVAEFMSDPKIRRLSELIDLRLTRGLTPEEEAESVALRGPQEQHVPGHIVDIFPPDSKDPLDEDDDEADEGLEGK